MMKKLMQQDRMHRPTGTPTYTATQLTTLNDAAKNSEPQYDVPNPDGIEKAVNGNHSCTIMEWILGEFRECSPCLHPPLLSQQKSSKKLPKHWVASQESSRKVSNYQPMHTPVVKIALQART